jgi:hypothetical protein
MMMEGSHNSSINMGAASRRLAHFTRAFEVVAVAVVSLSISSSSSLPIFPPLPASRFLAGRLFIFLRLGLAKAKYFCL